jgi:phospholipid/cholesterol/gamma-HCH transport system ATP-binding protein
MINAQNLYVSFGENQVLNGLNLEIMEGQIMVIVGRSGAGKSVFLKCLAALLKPDKGSVYIDGENITKASGKELLLIRNKIGMLFQEGALFDSMTVYENVAFPLTYHKMYTKAEIENRVRKYLDIVEMTYHLDAYPAELSGGMKRKVALARVMMLEPKYIFYDEPTSGLDPLSAAIVESMIKKLQQEMSITSLIVTHDIDLAKYAADKLALLENGKIKSLAARDKAFLEDSTIAKDFIYKRERVHQQNGY